MALHELDFGPIKDEILTVEGYEIGFRDEEGTLFVHAYIIEAEKGDDFTVGDLIDLLASSN